MRLCVLSTTQARESPDVGPRVARVGRGHVLAPDSGVGRHAGGDGCHARRGGGAQGGMGSSKPRIGRDLRVQD
jgi:hypothetical protein